MNKKITLLATLAFSAAIVTASVFAIHSIKEDPSISQIGANDESYTLVLNDKNQPAATPSSNDRVMDHTPYIQIEYKGSSLSVASGRHIRFGSGSFFNTKQIRKITSLKLNFGVLPSKGVVLYTGYTRDDIAAKTYSNPIYVANKDYTFNVACNYFEVYGSASYGLSSMTITYECPKDETLYEKPSSSLDKTVVHYGSANTGSSPCTLTNGQVAFADGLNNKYNYAYFDLSIQIRCPNAFSGDISNRHFGFQFHKTVSSAGALFYGYQMEIVNLGSGTATFKLSKFANDTITDIATKEDVAFTKGSFLTYHFVVTKNAVDSSKYDFTATLGETQLFNETLDSLGHFNRYLGLRHANVSGNAYPTYQNFTLTGSNS